MMKKKLLYLGIHYGVCLLMFLMIQKPIFILYNWGHGGAQCTLADWAGIYIHGLPLDCSMAAYLTVLPLVAVWCHGMCHRLNPRYLLMGYDVVVAVLLSLITLADSSLYEFWEFKLDATVFMYLDDPKNAFASVSAFYIALRVMALAGLSVLYAALLLWPLRRCVFAAGGARRRVRATVVFVLAGSLLFAIMRGVRIWPNTPGRAYYSKTLFHNHAALNPVFNLGYSVLHREDFSNQFNFFTDEECERLFAPMFPTQGTPEQMYLRTSRPNILVLVLEGFGACFIENLGGMKDVAREFNRISDDGVYFTRCYCSSFRTDRGIVSVVSGYPGQPTTSIMKHTRKVRSLAGLPKALKAYGYETSALYGGDVTFFNMSDYLIASGHDRLISETDFPASERTTKWGVPDHVTFEWMYEEILRRHRCGARPWYTTFLTISSHAPYDVPYHRLEDIRNNAFAYTDSCFGGFIDKLRHSPAWDNLLVVCIADHGFNYRKVASPDFPHIPMLWLGGALNTSCRIDKIVSQTDLPATVLGQMGIPHDDFPFSRDVLSDTYTYPTAFNSYINGFIFRDFTGCTVYDNTSGRALYGSDPQREKKGKAILQTLYDDLERR